MAEILKFPKVRRSAIDEELIHILTRALKLNDQFLVEALGTGAFKGESQDTVMDLIEANAAILAEAGRKKP